MSDSNNDIVIGNVLQRCMIKVSWIFELLSDIMFQNHVFLRASHNWWNFICCLFRQIFRIFSHGYNYLQFWRLSRYWTPVFVRDLFDLTKLKTSNLLSFLSKIIISDHVSCRDTFFGYTFSSKSNTPFFMLDWFDCCYFEIFVLHFAVFTWTAILSKKKSEEIILKWKVGVIFKLFKSNLNI